MAVKRRRRRKGEGNIHLHIREVRRSKQLRVYEVAHLAGIGATTLSEYERSVIDVPISRLILICNALREPAEKLLPPWSARAQCYLQQPPHWEGHRYGNTA